MSRISDKQFLIPDPKLSGFLDAIYRSAKSTSTGITFAVSVKPSFWRKRHEIITALLDASLLHTQKHAQLRSS